MVGWFTLSLASTLKTSGCNTASTAVSVEVRTSDGGNNGTATGSVVASGAASISGLNWTKSFVFASGTPADGKYDIRAVGSGSTGGSCPTNSDYCGIADNYFGVNN